MSDSGATDKRPIREEIAEIAPDLPDVVDKVMESFREPDEHTLGYEHGYESAD